MAGDSIRQSRGHLCKGRHRQNLRYRGGTGLLGRIYMCEIALSTIAETAATWHTTFALLLHSATTITSAKWNNLAGRLSLEGIPPPQSGGSAYARTARLRFSSATRGRFCWAGVEVGSSITGTGGVNVGEGRASSAEKAAGKGNGAHELKRA